MKKYVISWVIWALTSSAFAGGRVVAQCDSLGGRYSVEVSESREMGELGLHATVVDHNRKAIVASYDVVKFDERHQHHGFEGRHGYRDQDGGAQFKLFSLGAMFGYTLYADENDSGVRGSISESMNCNTFSE